MDRKKYILGNWKLNKNLSEIKFFFSNFNKALLTTKSIRSSKNIVYGFAPTYLGLSLAKKLKTNETLLIAQDVADTLSGSFTGQVSCLQLKDLAIKNAIVGHSETRKYLGCTDAIVNKKVAICLANKIRPIICIGETLTQYNNEQTKTILAKQLKTIFKGIKTKDVTKCIIAYEPIWAIGSGKTPSLAEINYLCGYIRKTISKLFNHSVAEQLPILYGGSVNKKNALDIITQPNVDGSLIGGTSLYPNKFAEILKDLDLWQKRN